MEMIMFFGFPFSFGFFLFSFGLLKMRIGIVLLFFCINSQDSAFFPSSVDLCFSKFAARLNFLMRHFHRRIFENIISLFLSFSNTERREVVFRTQWFISQYCSEREGRGYRCRCTSFSFYDGLLWLHSTPFPNNHRRPSKVLFRPKRRRFFPFPNNHRRPSKVLFFLLLQRISSLFFLLLLYGLAFCHFFNVQQVTKAAVFNVRVG